jgi:hypothetical protein
MNRCFLVYLVNFTPPNSLLNRFLLFFPLLLFPILLFAQENSASLELDQTIENHQFYSNQKEHTIDSLKQHKTCYEWPSKQGFMINYMKDIECISRIPHWFCSKVANRNQSERFKSTRSSTEPRLYHGNFGDVQRGYTFLQTGNRPQS